MQYRFQIISYDTDGFPVQVTNDSDVHREIEDHIHLVLMDELAALTPVPRINWNNKTVTITWDPPDPESEDYEPNTARQTRDAFLHFINPLYVNEDEDVIVELQ